MADQVSGHGGPGEVRDDADLARLGYVTRARITDHEPAQPCTRYTRAASVTALPPAVLLPTGKRQIRRVVAAVDWCVQRRLWKVASAIDANLPMAGAAVTPP